MSHSRYAQESIEYDHFQKKNNCGVVMCLKEGIPMIRFLYLPGLAGLLLLLFAPYVSAYVGLCCGKCGGNMPMNIMGGGIPPFF